MQIKTKSKSKHHTILTNRFVIAPLNEHDLALYKELYCDEKILEHVCPPLSEQQAIKAFNITLEQMTLEQPKIIAWTIKEKSSGKKVGFQAVTWYQRKEAKVDPAFLLNGQPEAGILLLEEYQGKGYAMEAIGALIEFTLNRLNKERIHFYFPIDHVHTIKVLNKLGALIDPKKIHKHSGWGYRFASLEIWNQKFITGLSHSN